MSDPLIELPSGDAPAATATNPLDQGRRMHQRQEWEQAFLAAQKQQGQAPVSAREIQPAPAEQTAAMTQAPAQSAIRQDRPASVPQTLARPAVAAPGAVAKGQGLPVNERAAAIMPDLAARSEMTARTHSRASAAASRAATAPPTMSRSGEPAEPVVVRAHERDGGVQLTIRDATLTPERARGFIARVRGLLQRFGLRLAALTLNGSRVVDAAPLPQSGAPSERARHHDLDLTL